MTIRSKGKRAWRCNNPGNLKKSSYSMGKDRRAIGSAGDAADEYAIYPDYQTGHEALVVMLRGSVYSPLTLKEASIKYVGSDKKHINKVMDITGFDPNRIIKSFSKEEFEIYWKAIEQIEGWQEGDEDFIEKWIVSGVHKKRGAIVEYLINQAGKNIWVAKVEAINLALQGRLHARLVRHKGSYYLRSEYGSKPFQITT